MRLLIGIALAAAIATAATGALAQAMPSDVASAPTYGLSNGGGAPTPLGAGYETPTRYETSVRVLKAQMDYQARRDGGHLTARHEAAFQQALDDTNRRFHKGPYARP